MKRSTALLAATAGCAAAAAGGLRPLQEAASRTAARRLLQASETACDNTGVIIAVVFVILLALALAAAVYLLLRSREQVSTLAVEVTTLKDSKMRVGDADAFDAPVVSILQTLHRLRDSSGDAVTKQALLEVIELIVASPNIYAPDVTKDMKLSSLDASLLTEAVGRRAGGALLLQARPGGMKTLHEDKPASAGGSGGGSGSGGGGGGGGWYKRRAAFVGGRAPALAPDASPAGKRLTKMMTDNPALVGLMASLTLWDFDVFVTSRLTQGQPLLAVAFHLFKSWDLLTTFNISPAVLGAFLRAVEAGYLDCHYHNSIHAADVVQSSSYFLSVMPQQGGLTDEDVLALLLGSAVHDLAHPGVNNSYLINTNHAVALMYNDQNVLENFHVAEAFAIMRQPGCDVLGALEVEQYRSVRARLISLVLATDLAEHFNLVNKFKSKFGPENKELNKNLETVEGRELLSQIMIKAADIAHSAKVQELHVQWSERITKEMTSQGDRERELGLPVAPHMNRETLHVCRGQVGFISFLVRPLFVLFGEYMQVRTWVDNIDSNVAFWKDEDTAEKAAMQKEWLETEGPPPPLRMRSKAGAASGAEEGALPEAKAE
eukprot:PLAT13992.1.p1 GENE.PLAT13992.1~~PLAT13992.1.p1  ORF type:complete len:614 (-),score=256.88 PLAT13992.1:78-1889(-)